MPLLSQVPASVQEEAIFGSVDSAVASCFSGVRTETHPLQVIDGCHGNVLHLFPQVLTPAISEDQALSWLLSEPRLLLWLPTLYRLSVSQNVRHGVRCHTCRTTPITGLR